MFMEVLKDQYFARLFFANYQKKNEKFENELKKAFLGFDNIGNILWCHL